MKKYYCPTCKKLKYRWELQKRSDTRVSFLVCKWCHNSNIYKTEDVMNKLIDRTLTDKDFNNRHGSYL
jgi:hypothetical protein